MHAFYYTKSYELITNKSPFCDKLLYIASNKNTQFEFLKKAYTDDMEDEEDNDDDYLNDDDPWLKLVPEGENEIVSEAVWNYRSTFLPTDNLDKALQQFNKLEAALTKCLVDHKKKLLTKEELGQGKRIKIIISPNEVFY